MTNQNPKVSVCVVTYNHEKYIAQCLQTLVDQVTNFDFEIIIGEDGSKDKTREIVETFARNYPKLIKPIFHKENVGPSENYYQVHAEAKGEYIAHLDGDDYALPGKLQAQADYLDAHPACNIVWHRMKIKHDRTGELLDDLVDASLIPEEGFLRVDLMRFITLGMHSSKMYRTRLREFEKPNIPVLDFYINVAQLGEGRAYLLGGRPLGVYRAGIGFASSGKSNLWLCETLHHFSTIYEDCKLSISAIATIKCLAALKNKRWLEVRCFFFLALRTMQLTTFFDIWKNRRIYAMLMLPTATLKQNGKG